MSAETTSPKITTDDAGREHHLKHDGGGPIGLKNAKVIVVTIARASPPNTAMRRATGAFASALEAELDSMARFLGL